MSKATTFDDFVFHLNRICSIDLETHLDFKNQKSIKDFALASSILVLYRYAEQLPEKIEVRDAVAIGHKSHQVLRSETDFDLAGNGDLGARDPLIQIRLAGDLLNIKDLAEQDLGAFRLGFYFDYFKRARNRATTYEEFRTSYEGRESGASMHIGARYKWISEEYQGEPINSGVTFGMWGRGGTQDGTGNLWEERIKEWNTGFLSDGEVDAVVRAFVQDCQLLDAKSPTPRVSNTWDDPLFPMDRIAQRHPGLMTISAGRRGGTDPRSAAFNQHASARRLPS